MTDDIERLARRTGLDRAWQLFPQDVADAVAGAADLRMAFQHPDDPADEPTPAMRAEPS